MRVFTYSLACAELVGVQLPRQTASSLVLLNLAIACLSRQSSKRVKTTIMITDASKLERLIMRSSLLLAVLIAMVVVIVEVVIPDARYVEKNFLVRVRCGCCQGSEIRKMSSMAAYWSCRFHSISGVENVCTDDN